MAASPNLIGIGAGIVAAVLFASLANNSALAFMLFYLTPLPVFLAGIGWGLRASALTLITAALLLGMLLSFRAAIAFGLFVGMPGVILSHMMLLYRTIPTGQAHDVNAPASQYRVEWYPFGRVVAWAAVIAGGLVALALVLLGGGGESYYRAIRSIFDDEALTQLQVVFGPQFGRPELDIFVARFSRYILPAFASTFWLLVIIGNIWLAAKSASISGLLHRPLPQLSKIDYPPFLLAGFVAALLLSFASGLVGLVGTAFLGAFSCAFLLLGLAVVHILITGSQFKLMLLIMIYVGLFLTPWVGPPVTLLGLLEPVLRLRERYWRQSAPPSNHSGPNP